MTFYIYQPSPYLYVTLVPVFVYIVYIGGGGDLGPVVKHLCQEILPIRTAYIVLLYYCLRLLFMFEYSKTRL